jgi:hypothetical protein
MRVEALLNRMPGHDPARPRSARFDFARSFDGHASVSGMNQGLATSPSSSVSPSRVSIVTGEGRVCAV